MKLLRRVSFGFHSHKKVENHCFKEHFQLNLKLKKKLTQVMILYFCTLTMLFICRTPFFNHGMGVKIEQKSKYHPVSIKTQLNNSFFAVKTSHEQQAQVFNYKMNLRLPSGFQVVNITFIQPYSSGHDHLIVQTNTTKYTCHTSNPESTVYNLNCSVQQVSESFNQIIAVCFPSE